MNSTLNSSALNAQKILLAHCYRITSHKIQKTTVLATHAGPPPTRSVAAFPSFATTSLSTASVARGYVRPARPRPRPAAAISRYRSAGTAVVHCSSICQNIDGQCPCGCSEGVEVGVKANRGVDRSPIAVRACSTGPSNIAA